MLNNAGKRSIINIKEIKHWTNNYSSGKMEGLWRGFNIIKKW
jgi:hypothetical protein